MAWIMWPGELPDNPEYLGGKGASLWSLLGGGFPVPPGFCLTAASYRCWAGSGHPDDLPPPVNKALVDAMSRLSSLTYGGDSYVVRSSAVAEDSPNASFAGQLQSHLNIPANEVPRAVVSVWRSGDAEAVAAYRDRMGTAQSDIAVVVQPLVPAEASGVLFTADPVTGNRDRVVINAGWGLGEGVVRGLMTPDHWVVERGSRRNLETRPGRKARMVVAGPPGRTELVDTPEDLARLPALTPSQRVELVQLGLQVEAHFGTPQDIEWSYWNGRFWLLQSRPITVPSQEGWVSEFDSKTDPETVWTAANIQEVLTDVVAPLDWSLLRECQNYALRKPFLDTHTLLDPATEFVALFYGRAFANVSALRRVASRAIGTSPEAIDEQYLGKARDPKVRRPRLSPRRLMAYLDTTPRIIQLLYRTGRSVPVAEAQLRPWLEQARRLSLDSLSTQELLAQIHEANDKCRDMSALHISTSSGASIFFESLGQLLRKWFGSEGTELEARLITGLDNVPSAAPGLELAELAAPVATDAELRAAVTAQDPWSHLKQLSSPAAAEFRARVDSFLSRYGHRGLRELEVAEPAWEEGPNSVLALLRNIVNYPPGATPAEVQARQQAQRLAATETVSGRLDPVRRWTFRFVLRQAQSYVALREQTKSLWMEVNHCLRRLFRTLGRRLCEQGLLADPQDIYFLTFDEVEALSQGRPVGLVVAEVVRRRRLEVARNRRVKLPKSFQGRPKPLLDDASPMAGRALEGIPVSPGVVTGPARVILDPREAGDVRSGDILVAPCTDVGWAPLFLVVSGLVADVGGPLSHGSIVAREYGLPAVVNVHRATELLKSGQIITINGSTGKVFLE